MKKLTYSYVKEQIEKNDYVLLSKEYKNNSTKLKVKCNKGHEYKVIYNSFMLGHRCPICKGVKKYTYEEVNNEIKKKNWKLISTEYKNTKQELEFKCDNNHMFKLNFDCVKRGIGCSICSGKQKHSYDYVKEQIENTGYELLSKEYKNNYTKLKIRCNKGHKYEVNWNNFKNGSRCPICKGLKCSKRQLLTYDYVKEQIEKNDYVLLSKEYKNNSTKLKVKCNKGHEYKVTYGDFQQGKRCPKCFGSFSKSEKEISEYIKSFGLDVIENDRGQVINPLTNYPLEIDIFIPEYHKAIEFNGKYWHSNSDVKERDLIKKQQCEENGIGLLVIDEQEWIDSKNGCLKEIKEFIGV